MTTPRWEHQSKRLRVLHVEDDDTDALLLMEALDDASRDWRVYATIMRVHSAEEALELLDDTTEHLPHLIMLDLSLPGQSGHDLLAHIKSGHRASRVPVVVVSTSGAKTDVSRAYASCAASYLVKPSNYLDLISLMEALARFWLHHVKFPEP